jgi:superfamily II DNA or RNA helicase/HKD family nuclease
LGDNSQIVKKDKFLSEVKSPVQQARETATGRQVDRPLSGFRVSNLFTGGNSELSLNSEIQKDIASADRICIIVSFLKLSGLHLIYDNLKDFCNQEGHILRVITTTYCGITEAKAVEQLSNLPRTEIRISYNTSIERLHAKSYIFERNSGLDTAYIGSSNLSKSAQTDGLEWNIRVTMLENPHIIKTAKATFDMYWNSQNFEDYRTGGIDKFIKETQQNRSIGSNDHTILQRYEVLPHQKSILEKLMVERDNGCIKNLIVAATGTGKTVISAFDYRQFYIEHPTNNKLLFIAHRQEILKQSLYTYRSIMHDANFGDLWVGNYRPDNKIDHLFVSVQTFNSNFDDVFSCLDSDYYDYIVVDEAHHIVASSYRKIMDKFSPKLLIGLTATPDRMDGSSLLPDFDNKISAEIRLPKALDEGLLTPFQYYCISDHTDLTDEELWVNGRVGKYIVSKLSERLCKSERIELIIDRLSYYLPDEHKCKALCFCADKRHAEYMSNQFNDNGLKSDYLISDNSDDRERLNKELEEGKINYLFVVDMFNEGVDIPSIDTVMFLRPTESLTIFLQQLGRGLRLYQGKTLLTVLDFVAQVNRNYDFTSRFRALFTKSEGNVAEQILHGFTLLPHGCSINMEEKAQKYVLQCIKSAIYNKNKLIAELQSYASTPTLSQFVESNGQDIRLIYKNGLCWSALKRMAGKCQYVDDDFTHRLEKGIGSLVHINSIRYLQFIKKVINAEGRIFPISKEEDTFSLMLYYNLFQDKISRTGFNSIYEALVQLGQYPIFLNEIKELADYLIDHLSVKTAMVGNNTPEALEVYGCYTREEIFCMFGRQTPDRKMQGSAAGVFNVEEYNTELFFVTLNKSDREFSPSTQYNDYVISENLFNWQSQNTDAHSGRGARFVDQAINKKRFMIFVREDKKDGYGNTCPFYCFGFGNYVSSNGDYPMNIVWRMEKPIMVQFLKAV